MDPISIGLMLAGLGSSLFGGFSNAKAVNQDAVNQLQTATQRRAQQLDEAKARNAVLDTYMGRQDQYKTNNYGSMHDAVQSFDAPAQETKRAAEESKLGGAISSAIGTNSDYRTPTLSLSATPGVSDVYDTALAEALDKSREGGARMARMGSYGNTWAGNADVVDRNAGRINTTNTIARNDLSNLPTAQDLAGFQTERIINTPAPTDRSLGSLLTGLGSALGAAGGSGKLGSSIGNSLSGLGSIFGIGNAATAGVPLSILPPIY